MLQPFKIILLYKKNFNTNNYKKKKLILLVITIIIRLFSGMVVSIYKNIFLEILDHPYI